MVMGKLKVCWPFWKTGVLVTALQSTPEILTDPDAAGRAAALLMQEAAAQAPLIHLPMTVLSGAAAAAVRTAFPWCRLERAGETFFVTLPAPRLEHVRRSAGRSVRRAGRAGIPVSVAVHSARYPVTCCLGTRLNRTSTAATAGLTETTLGGSGITCAVSAFGTTTFDGAEYGP